jgi:hypothetical protein
MMTCPVAGPCPFLVAYEGLPEAEAREGWESPPGLLECPWEKSHKKV